MNFKFRLQNVLDIREQEYKQACRVLDEIRNKQVTVQRFLSEEVSIYYAERDEFNSVASRGETQKLSHIERGLEMRKRRILEIMQALRDVENDLELAELSVQQANKNLKMMDNLKEKKNLEFEALQRKKGQIVMDEFNIARFARRSDGDA